MRDAGVLHAIAVNTLDRREYVMTVERSIVV
jgi:hypothetical protein